MLETKRVNTKQLENQKVKKSNKFLYSLAAITVGLLMGMFFILISGNSVFNYFSNLWNGSFGNLENFGNMLGNLAWVIPIGLAMVVSFRAGIFNIGSAGQMLFAGFMAYLVAILIGGSLGSFGGILVIALVAILSGALLAWLMAMLKTKFGVNEVITSIMFNWIIFWFVSWGYSNIDFIFDSATNSVKHFDQKLSLTQDWLTNLFNGSTKINIGIFVSIFFVVGLILLYNFTKFGFKQDIVGSNNKVSEYLGLNKDREYLKALLLSGSLAGAAGWIYYFGLQDSFPKQVWQINGDLYQGITVALIGFNSFAGAFFSSIFISIFMNSGSLADSTVGSLPVTDLILAIIIIMLTLVQFLIIYRPQDNWFNEESWDTEIEWKPEKTEKYTINKSKKESKLKKQKESKPKKPKKEEPKVEEKFINKDGLIKEEKPIEEENIVKETIPTPKKEEIKEAVQKEEPKVDPEERKARSNNYIDVVVDDDEDDEVDEFIVDENSFDAKMAKAEEEIRRKKRESLNSMNQKQVQDKPLTFDEKMAKAEEAIKNKKREQASSGYKEVNVNRPLNFDEKMQQIEDEIRNKKRESINSKPTNRPLSFNEKMQQIEDEIIRKKREKSKVAKNEPIDKILDDYIEQIIDKKNKNNKEEN